MDRFDTPDVLVGVGGAGSSIVYEFMEQDWILDSAVGTGQFAGAEPQPLKAYTIDSALDDSVHDRVGEIQSTIDELISEHETADPMIDVSLEHRSVTTDVPSEWRQTNMLTAAENVGRMLSKRRMNAWWFAEGREPLQKMKSEGFAGGVYRRRAVSKALFHLSEYAGDGVTPPSGVDDEVVMVAAIGGGTGSGTIVDLAAEMDADHVDLFAVIPTTGEKQKEKANAFAALSELEYLETSGESPFRTITLIPYLGGSGGVGEATDDEAATAAVRTIVAHHQGMRGRNLRDMLNTTSRNGPPGYSSFTVAAPKTIEYNIEKKDRAKAEIRETVDRRHEELGAEANLCDLTSAFLDREFPDTLDTVDEPETEERRRAMIGLSRRVERLFEETLQQEAVRVAGVAAECEELIDLYRQIDENVVDNPQVGSSEADEAEARAGRTAERLREHVTPTDYGEDGSIGQRLAKVVRRELGVVSKRHELLSRIYRIPAIADELGLTDDEAVTVRDVFTDVVLDADESLLGVVQTPSFSVVVDQYEEERDELVQKHEQYDAFESELRSELATKVSDVRSGVEEHVATVAEVDRRFPEVASGRSVIERIDRLAAEVRETVDDVLRMDRPGTVDPSLEFDEFEELNADLEAVGVDPIPGDTLERGLQRLLDAKNASLDHNSGLIPGRPDRTADYQNAVNWLNNELGFVVGDGGYVPAVDEPFDATFDESAIRRYEAVAAVRQRAVEGAVDGALGELCGTDGELFQPDTGALVETRLDRGVEYLRVTVDPPTGLTSDALREEVRRRLREGEQEDPQVRLERLFPRLSESHHEPESLTTRLEEAYLRPVDRGIEEIETSLEQLGDNGVTDSEGTLETLGRLRALAGRFEQTDRQAELPSVTTASEDEVYGADFTELCEGGMTFDIGLDRGTNREDHPYVHDRDADTADLAGSPDDIEESDVLQNRADEIFGLLGRSAEHLFRGRYDRAPVSEFEPQGSGDDVDAVYRDMRYVNVFFSRALDERENLTPEDGTLHPEVTEVFEKHTPFEGDTYGEAQFGIGGPDGVTMVTFVAGLTLDNVARVTGADGYKATYERMYRNHSFLPTHHAVGLGGNWDRWERLRESTADDRAGPEYGAFVYRDTVRQMDTEFVTELQRRDDEEVVELIQEMISTETFDSTIGDEESRD